MTAGESAREVARRRREKARRLEQMADAYERGAAGEEATAAALAGLPPGWWVFHDVRWPGRQRANIDHVVIGPGGVFVIDSKHWAGNVTVADDVLRQNGRSREKAVAGVAEAALAVTSVIGQVPAVPVLCFVRDEPVSGWARDVMVCTTANLVEMLLTRPPTLHPATIARLLPVLQRNLVSASAPPTSVGPRMSNREVISGMRSSAPRRGRHNHGPTVGRLLTLIVGVLALIFVGIPILTSLSDGVTKGIGNVPDNGLHRTPSPKPTKAEFGSTLSLGSKAGDPDLRVTVRRPRDTTAIRGGSPASGRHLIAVPIRLVNKGSQPWAWGERTQLILQDTIGTSYGPTRTYRQVVAGQALRGSPTLTPGEVLERIAVFEVPVGSRVGRILFAVDPGFSTILRWSPHAATG